MNILPRFKPVMKRTPQEEAAIRVRLLDGTAWQDIYYRCKDELGDRQARGMGPIDITGNPLDDYCSRVGRAYSLPVFVYGLAPELATLVGDASAMTLVERWATRGGHPLPTTLQDCAARVLRYRLGCNRCGLAVGWDEQTQRPTVEPVTPDLLDVTYRSDSPLAPTVIRWARERTVDGHESVLWDVSDLSDPAAPTYRVLDDAGADYTEQVLGSGWSWPEEWRYADGRPFHRIIISGDWHDVYGGIRRVEGSLRVAVGLSYWWANMRDAGHPARHVEGLHLAGEDSDTGEGMAGTDSGPTTVQVWSRDDPSIPGQHWQDGPGFDPEIFGRALWSYEQRLTSQLDIPVAFEQTGGEPTETERQAVEEAIQGTYTGCRILVSLALRRLAAMCNRRLKTTFAEAGYGSLYRREIDDLFPPPTPTDPQKGQTP